MSDRNEVVLDMGELAMRSALCTLGLLGASVAAVPACTDETVLTDEQRETLAQFRLPAAPPADPSNQYADDARAAVLGKKFFFDTRFSGPLGAINDGVSHGSLGAAVRVASVIASGDPKISGGT